MQISPGNLPNQGILMFTDRATPIMIKINPPNIKILPKLFTAVIPFLF